jgi:hypothetical protein
MNTQDYNSLKEKLFPEASQIASSKHLDTLSFNLQTQQWTTMLLFDTPRNRDAGNVMFYFGERRAQ